MQLACEVDILQQLHHESLVGFLFMVDDGARLSVVMEWAGCGLKTLLEPQQQPLGEDVARYITYQLTASLAWLHHKVRRAQAVLSRRPAAPHRNACCCVLSKISQLQTSMEAAGQAAKHAAMLCGYHDA